MDEKLRTDGLQLSVDESNRQMQKVEEKLSTIVVILITAFIIFLCVAILIVLYIDQKDLLFYLSGR